MPRLGQLMRLEVAAAESPGGPGGGSAGAWNAARACMLAGVVAAFVGATTAVWLRGLRLAAVPFDERSIRASAAAAAADVIHQSWLEFERQGIARLPFAEEQRMQQQARLLAPLETAAWAFAAAGGAVAAAAFIAADSRR